MLLKHHPFMSAEINHNQTCLKKRTLQEIYLKNKTFKRFKRGVAKRSTKNFLNNCKGNAIKNNKNKFCFDVVKTGDYD